jgi:hypothetical protein
MMTRVVLMAGALLASAPLHAVDLMDLYREARENDTQTAAARAHYRGMQERVPQARAGRYPDARFDVTHQNNAAIAKPGVRHRGSPGSGPGIRK